MFGKKKDGNIGKYSLTHIQGLDIPVVICSVVLAADKVTISGAGKEYSLSLQKIQSVDFQMEVDIQKYSKSSIVGGIAGAAVFGAAGAVIGSAPRSKTERLVTGCAVLGYTASDGSQSYILLQSPQANDMQAAKFVDKLRPLIASNSPQSIEL